MGRVRMKVLLVGLVLLALLFLISYGCATLLGDTPMDEGHILVIPLEGVIQYDGGSSMFSAPGGISSKDMVKTLERVAEDESVRAVLLDINSPGGTVVGSEEVASAVAALDVPVYAVVHEVAASGGYWIASSAGHIVASPMSIVGSIGVISSYLEFSELFEEYGVGHERLVAGEFKDVGSPYKSLSLAERTLLQEKLDVIHSYFVSSVATSRELEEEAVWELATGEYYLGVEAVDLGLVDSLGTKQDALDALEASLNVTDIKVVESKQQKNILSYFAQSQAYSLGRGFGDALVSRQSTVPLAM